MKKGLLSIILWAVGLIGIGIFFNWKLAVLIYLLFWANNLERK